MLNMKLPFELWSFVKKKAIDNDCSMQDILKSILKKAKKGDEKLDSSN
jgi:hypothetical protein